MEITLAADRRARLATHLQQLFAKEFDETLSEFRAGEIIDLMLRTLGPVVYNQAVDDVREHFQKKLDDL
ncbi:MAG: DUF2164 family protein [Alphaproteobacteria bacterium]|nr:DUF2164 family protein [Alphaproteobacteria bacterium]